MYPGQGFNQNPYGNNPPPPPQYGGQQGQHGAGYGYQQPPPQFSGGGQGYQQGGYAPPPPPPQQYGGGGGGYGYQQPQQGGGHGYQQGGGGYQNGGGGGQGYQSGGGDGYRYQPPTGAPVPSSYAPTSAGYQPPNSAPTGYYSAPSGAPPTRPPTGSQHYGPQLQGQGGVQQPYFQYSQCTGKRKALLIGINYLGQNNALRGCINDVHNVQKFLVERYGYRPDDMVVLTDDAKNSRQIPTKANMIAAMRWLVQGAQPNDALFFHYSGHGGQTRDLDGDEDDGMDEVVYPVDFKTAGHLVDDEMHALMVRPLPAGARLTAIFDSCHSATALDLPYVYSTEGKIKEPNLLAEAGSGVLTAGMSYLKGDIGGMMSGLMNVGKQVMGGATNSGATAKTRQTRTAPADVVMWSGCKDSQTSADTQEAGKATGAMSYAFIAAMTKNPKQSYVQLLRSIRQELQGRYDQKPQLSSSHPIDTNLLFIC